MPPDHLGGGYNAESQAPPAEPRLGAQRGGRPGVGVFNTLPLAGDRRLLLGKNDQHVGCPVSGSLSVLSPGSL